MRPYKKELWQKEIESLFEGDDREAVLDWLVANEGRRRVVMVGAGFTRNALTRTGTRASTIPTWPEVTRAMQEDLRLQENDPLTLADFYMAQMSGNALHARLLDLVPDSDLRPGPAHEALARYEAEAIVTTNFLDTVLEHAPADIVRVVSDPDLALPAPVGASENFRQLIYFHGHRSEFDSWVVGRSHYEDLPNNRPMIHARVRQLFAQFPLLLVGYSLTDPDFHLIYRDMVRCMSKRHPMGLALVPPGRSGRARAARTYWEGLGLRVAAFARNVDLSDGFVRFFHLTRRAVTAGVLLDHLKSPNSLSDVAESVQGRMRFVGDVLDDPNAAQVVRDFGPTTKYRLWREALELSLPAEVLKNVVANATLAMRRRPAGVLVEINTVDRPADKTQPHEPEPLRAEWGEISGFMIEPSWLDERSKLIRVVDVLLAAGSPRADLARWFQRALNDDDLLDAAEANEEDILKVTAHLWATLPGQGADIVGDVLRRCMARAELFQYPSALALRRCFEALRSSVGELELGDAMLRSPVDEELRRATNALLNDDVDVALEAYRNALRQADASSDPIGAWLAAQGVSDATFQAAYTRQWPSSELQTLQDEAKQRAEHPRVKHLLEKAESLHTTLNAKGLERLRAEIGQAGFESHNMHFSVVPYKAWRLFRQLRERGAPRSLQVWLLKPLLNSDDRFADELQERLTLNIKGTPAWLKEQVGGAAAREDEGRDEQIVNAVVRTRPAHRSEREARVLALPEIVDALAVADIASAVALLTDLERSDSDFETGRAWRALAGVCKWQDVSTGLLSFVTSPIAAWWDLSLRPSELPWEHWVACDDFVGAGGDGFVTKLLAEGVPSSDLSNAGWALANFTSSSAGEPGAFELGRGWVDQMLASSNVTSDALHAMTAVACRVWEGEERSSRIHQIFQLAALTDQARVPGGIEAVLVVASRCLTDKVSDPEIETQFAAGILWVRDNWTRLAKRFPGHPGECTRFAWILAMALSKNPAEYAWTRARLLELTRHSWGVLPFLCNVLTQRFWGDAWLELVSTLRFGGRSRAPKSWLVEFLDLWRDALREPEKGGSAVLENPDLEFMQFIGLQACTDPDTRIANHAGYGAVRLAGLIGSDERGVGAVLRAIAADRRAIVRHAAAFGGATLQHTATSEEIRAVARELDAILASDDIAVVQRQREFGAAIARKRRRQ